MRFRTVLPLSMALSIDSTFGATGQTPQPPGTAQHRSPEANIYMQCSLVSIMALGAYTGAKEAGQKEQSATLHHCLDQKMPSNWPGRANARAIAERDFAAAAAIDPNLSNAAPASR